MQPLVVIHLPMTQLAPNADRTSVKNVMGRLNIGLPGKEAGAA